MYPKSPKFGSRFLAQIETVGIHTVFCKISKVGNTEMYVNVKSLM